MIGSRNATFEESEFPPLVAMKAMFKREQF